MSTSKKKTAKRTVKRTTTKSEAPAGRTPTQLNVCRNLQCKLRKGGCRGFEGCPGFKGE